MVRQMVLHMCVVSGNTSPYSIDWSNGEIGDTAFNLSLIIRLFQM